MTFREDFTQVSLKDTALFQQIQLGPVTLQHRVALAPMTRLRCTDGIPGPLVKKYYDQRSKKNGTLIFIEGTHVSPAASGLNAAPGIWSQEQVDEWKKIFDVIHGNGSFVIHQIYAMGRQADSRALATKGLKYQGATDDLYIDKESERAALAVGNPVRGLTKEEIRQSIRDHVKAAKNSLEAGADLVELHLANGYLLNQFIDASSNRRTDEYGGSIENRARFPLEILDAMIAAIGAGKVGVRLSPYGEFGAMYGIHNPLIVAQYAYLVGEIEKRARNGSKIAFIHLVEPRAVSSGSTDGEDSVDASNDFVYSIWKGVIIRAGDYALHPELAMAHASMPRTVLAYGRSFISNPDLPDRLAAGHKLSGYDRATFYTPGAEGYVDYPTYDKLVQ